MYLSMYQCTRVLVYQCIPVYQMNQCTRADYTVKGGTLDTTCKVVLVTLA